MNEEKPKKLRVIKATHYRLEHWYVTLQCEHSRWIEAERPPEEMECLENGCYGNATS